jgi:hypothetical protein
MRVDISPAAFEDVEYSNSTCTVFMEELHYSGHCGWFQEVPRLDFCTVLLLRAPCFLLPYADLCSMTLYITGMLISKYLGELHVPGVDEFISGCASVSKRAGCSVTRQGFHFGRMCISCGDLGPVVRPVYSCQQTKPAVKVKPVLAIRLEELVEVSSGVECADRAVRALAYPMQPNYVIIVIEAWWIFFVR